jgi:RimJ/RimL family protein N-acetyltransferase
MPPMFPKIQKKPVMTLAFPIQTSRLIIRPFEAADIDDVIAYHSRPDVTQYLYWKTRNHSEVRKVLKKRVATKTLRQEGDSLVLAVEVIETCKVIGDLYLMWRSQEHQQAEIGFVFNPDYHGQGYATEASEVILSLGFREYGFHRIFGRCDARNVASYRLMERLGMRREAHLIHNELFKGEWSDELIYAILQNEWVTI